MKSLGIIPARGGSKSIPWKNITKLNGKPLIVYTIEAALASKLNSVIVSTDSEKIAKISKDNGAEVMMRPAELARDDSPTLPVLQYVVENMHEKFDCVVCFQPTSPFRTAKHINESLELFETETEADSLVSVVKVPHNMTPSSLMELRGEYIKSYVDQDEIILRRQDKPQLFARNGPAILIMNMDSLESGELYAGKTIPYVMDTFCSIDIDNESDLIMAEYLVNFWNTSN